MDFYKRLNYSLGNEDWNVESQALRVKSGDRVVCVTASGDRPLHLLMTDCAEIVSIDMNRIQNYLLDLKLAAISHLDYEKYLEFLGCEPTRHRRDMFKQLKPHLAPDSAKFWDDHKKMIDKGILYQGLVERVTSVAAKFFKTLRRRKVAKLLSFTDIEAQRVFVEKEWDTRVLREIFDLFLNTNILKYVLNDPGLNSNVDASIHPGEYIYQRMKKYLHTNLARKSVLLQLVFSGKILPDAYFPYLTLAGYTKIRRDAGRLKYRTDNIVEYLDKHNGAGFDGFSMSDIASYMPQAIFEKLLSAMHSAANPGARFCLREFMTKRQIPTEFNTHFKRDSALEEKLETEETNFIYRFFAGEIHK